MTDRVLICRRQIDVPQPVVRSKTGKCNECGKLVWIAFSSPRAERIWCMQCAGSMMEDDDHIEPPTSDQLEDFWKSKAQ